MKKLYLIRHGKSEANENYDVLWKTKDSDIELINEGYLDAIEAGKNLKSILKANTGNEIGNNEPFFIVSPWTRAYQTYQVIATVLNIPLEPLIDENVREHDMNLTNNIENWNKFLDYKNEKWNTEKYMNVKFHGGESLHDVRERAKYFLGFAEELLYGLGYNNIVVVSHGQFIKMALSEIDKKDPKDIVHPENGEVIVREIK